MIMGRLNLVRPDAQVGQLSGGERRRVALAQLLVAAPDLAVMDEPTNHLDVETIEWLEDYLVDSYPGALVLITHDRYILDRVVSRTLEVERGQVHSYEGGWEDYLTAKAERAALEARTEANRQNFLRRELEWLRRQPKARTGKQKARIDRAHKAQQAAPEARRDQMAKLSIKGRRMGGTIVELEALGLEIAGRELVRDLTFRLGKGERIGIIGRNGTGKTTLIRAIVGEREPERGKVTVGKNTRFAYFDQGRGDLEGEKNIAQNVAGDEAYISLGERKMDVRSYLERFLFSPEKQRQKVKTLSGGERARVILAKMMLQSANVVVLDEPTNDLDATTLGAVEEMIVDMEGSALVVSHDRYFLDRVATGLLVFEGDGKVVQHAGTYRDYRARKKLERTAQAEQPVKKAPTAKAPKAKSKTKLSWKEERELEGILDRVAEAETRVSEIQAKLSDPDLYATQPEKVTELTSSLSEAEAEVLKLTQRWEELETLKASFAE